MNDSPIEDFDELSFEEWLDFVFDEKWSDLENTDYFDLDDLNADIDVFIGNCIRLFEKPDFLLEKYSEKQLEGGLLNFILSPRVSLDWWLWDNSQPEDLRRRFIFSSINFFKEVLAVNPLGNTCFMWWDCLRDFSHERNYLVAGWIFGALSQILEIDSLYCQLSALHGLGHLEHKGKQALIEKFLRQHPKFGDKKYARMAIEGKVL